MFKLWLRKRFLKHIGYLLSLANSNPDSLPIWKREFYRFKDQVLKEFGTIDGVDIQYIEKECWTCDGTGIFVYSNGDKKPCYRCLSGIYESVWVVLTRFMLGNFLFHLPISASYVRPECEFKLFIEGYVHHDEHSNWTVKFAFLRLTLLLDRQLFLFSLFRILKRPFRRFLLKASWKAKSIKQWITKLFQKDDLPTDDISF